MRTVEEGTEWVAEPFKGFHLGVNRITHLMVVGLDLGPARATLEVPPTALERIGLEFIRFASSTFDFTTEQPCQDSTEPKERAQEEPTSSAV